MEIHSVRIEHGPVQTPTMSYSQRQPQNHRPNHSSQAATDIYKPSRSPLSTAARYPYPASPQLQPQTQPTISQVQVSAQRYPPGAAVFTGGFRDYRSPRISLLHPEYRARETLPGGAGVVHIDAIAQGQQPIKKIRLQDHKDNIQPLRIDTREQPGTYNPQVEAISPTLPDHLQQEEQTFRTTKDELIQQIGKVDREIAKAESQITILKKKEKELEEIANKPSVKSEVEEDAKPKHLSLPQKIYAENRKKAQTAHAKLDSLGPKVEWPLYNQPSDTAVYHENKRKNVAFKKRLLEYFKRRHAEKDSRNAYLTETYSKLMQEWLRKVDKIESSTKRKAKEAKNREFFEKVFPELRKQREDKERWVLRFNRVGARVKSEADMEEIMDNLQEQALEDKKMRSYAVIPPILLDARERKIAYQNDNGFIEDMEIVYKSRQFLNIWTPSEKEIFKEKYLQHPKNFGVIASFIERKSVADCVQYYYLSKKTENYKQLLRKSRQRTRSSRNNTQKVNSSANTSVVDILTTGVTTRLQREQQQQRTVVQQSRDPPAAGESSSSSTTSSTTTSVPTPATTTIATTSAGSSSAPTTSTSSTSTPTSTATASTAATTSVTTSSTSATSNAAATAAATTTTTSCVTAVSSAATAAPVASASAQPSSPKAADNATNGSESGKTTSFSDFNAFEDYRGQAGKFFGDDAKGDGSATAADATHDGVVVQVKKENEPSTQEDQSADPNMTSSSSNQNALSENKKKKERRKDNKENAAAAAATAAESSDDEASGSPDKSIQGNCIVCSSQLGPHLQSRPLVPSQAPQYGLREDQVPPNGRVCNTCRCKCVRSRYTHCPLPSCPNPRGRVKRLRSFPQRFQDLPPEMRDPILSEFHVPTGVTKCCSACFNRIQRRLGPIEEWSEDEISQLKNYLTEHGANWQLIGEKINKAPHQVRAFYSANRKRLNLEACLGDRKPTLTDEEESGSSTSSCEPMRDLHSSDTASAAESPPVAQANQNPIKKEDYDSSATETADEAQTPDHYQGSATITPVTNDGQPRQNASPLSVKDLVLNVIEFSLMKNPGVGGAPPTSGMAPTISSILNNDSNEVTIVSEYNLPPQQQQQSQQRAPRNDLSLAKLVTPLIGATITPVPVSHAHNIQQQTQLDNSRDDLVVLTVQDGRNEPETLDLSIKKPREPPPPAHAKHQPQQQIIRSDPYLAYHQERKSPAFIRSQQTKLPSPKPANPKTGSITMGTPIINQPRYEGLLRQMPDAKMGSITQGTPIHMPHMQEKRVYEYYNKRVPGQSPVAQQPSYQYRQQPYTVQQQLTSRQIIMDDYITSQQMLSRRNDKPQYYPANSPHRTPPPPQQVDAQAQQQQRQGVIQRHTRPQYLPPGHEALSSLVDVAVQQPSLPVPNAPHEGLGKTMADNIMEQPHRLQIIQHQQQLRQQLRHQQRIDEQRRIAYQQQQQQAAAAAAAAAAPPPPPPRHQSRGADQSTSLTAASLIDAIITHQINQTAEGGREIHGNPREPPRAGDLLFQSFHRDPPSQDNNGERPPSVISIDLDSDTVNKNLTVKELTDSVISHDFSTRVPSSGQSNYYHIQDEQWKRRLQQQQKDEGAKRAVTPQQDERQIIRIAQPQQKYHVEPVSPPDNHWSAGGNADNFRRYQQPQAQQISAFDYVKNRIVEVMRTENDNKKENQESVDKDRSDSPGEMVIDEEKHEENFGSGSATTAGQQNFNYFVHKDSTANDSSRNNEPKPLLSAQYEPLSDED